MDISERADRSVAALRNAVTSSGLTRKDLSDATGIPYASLSRKLSGRSDITMTDLFLLAEALGLPPSAFVPATRADPVRTDPARTEPVRAEARRTDPPRTRRR